MFFAPWPREGPEFFHVIEDYRPEELYPSSLLSFPPPLPPAINCETCPIKRTMKIFGTPVKKSLHGLQVYFFAVWKRRVFLNNFICTKSKLASNNALSCQVYAKKCS